MKNTTFSSQFWHQQFLRQAKWTRYIRSHFLENHNLPEGGKVLEVGCGTGAVLSEFEKTDCVLFGLDLDPGVLRISAQTNFTASLVTGDAHILPYPDNSFDLVFCHYLLLWVSEPEKALSEMVRVTRPGGCVAAFAEPDYGGRIDAAGYSDNLKALQIISLRNQNANPLLGRMLPGMFQQSELSKVQSGILGAEWKDDQIHNFSHDYSVLINDLKNTSDPATRSKLEELAAEMKDSQPGFSFVPTFYAWGKKRNDT